MSPGDMNLKTLLGLATATLALGAGCYSTGDGGDEGDGSDGADGGWTSGSGGSTSGSGGKGGTTGSGSGGSAGSSSGGSSTGGSGGAYQCSGDASVFETFDKSCTNVSDCVIVNHTSSCCGDSLRMAINASDAESFSAAESYCSAQFPACGCAAQGISAEDGSLVQFGSEDLIVAQCTDNVCNSYYSGPSFQCLTRVCTEEQYCTITTGGPAGSEPYANCNFHGGCSACDCISSVGCQCTEQDGHVTITCAAP